MGWGVFNVQPDPIRENWNDQHQEWNKISILKTVMMVLGQSIFLIALDKMNIKFTQNEKEKGKNVTTQISDH